MKVALGLALLPWLGMSAALIPVMTKSGAVATETVAIPNLVPAAAYSTLRPSSTAMHGGRAR